MTLSVFDLFKVGIGPSSSHTVGPMRAAGTFVREEISKLTAVARVECHLYGSLGATGIGHATDTAVILGLMGEVPETVDPKHVAEKVTSVREHHLLPLHGVHPIEFSPVRDMIFDGRNVLPGHPNGMELAAWDQAGTLLARQTYYSVGGGFIVSGSAHPSQPVRAETQKVRYPFESGAELLEICDRTGLSIADVMYQNELTWHGPAQIRTRLKTIWQVMQECVHTGIHSPERHLPGGLRVPRRAPKLYADLRAADSSDPLSCLDRITLFALAVNEENAAGGRVVTAPTNGAAGIIPAVLHYYRFFVEEANDDGVLTFLLTAGAIGSIVKNTASISGAEVGCQGEIGSACSMAAAGLTAAMGGTPAQIENAAEIGMEHNLGLTCDPVGGLVQIPCIERNAIAAVKAITAARTALRGDGSHVISLDSVLITMRETGRDMMSKYKETATGGLAVHAGVPLNVIEC